MPLEEIMSRKFSVFLLLALFSPPAFASDVIELSTFPKHAEETISRCYDWTMAATQKGRALCKEQGSNSFWVCPASKILRLDPLQHCDSDAQKVKDRAAMLYLLGLMHLDFRYQGRSHECPRFYRYQEGSSVCVYTNDHFQRVIEEFPDSRYADMAAFKIADEDYRYYECEGGTLCSVENEIAGWIDFLKARPGSRFAGHATDTIVASFDRLSNARLDPREEIAEGLLKDIETLSGLAGKLSPENRRKLENSLKKARPILIKAKEAYEKARLNRSR